MSFVEESPATQIAPEVYFPFMLFQIVLPQTSSADKSTIALIALIWFEITVVFVHMHNETPNDQKKLRRHGSLDVDRTNYDTVYTVHTPQSPHA